MRKRGISVHRCQIGSMRRRASSLLPDGSGANRWVARACVGALLVVLCFLAGFSLLTENDLAGRAAGAQRATRLGQLYSDARFWVGQEESLERKYRLEPSAAVLQLHTAAEDNLTRDLDAIGRIDQSAGTQQLVGRLIREQRLYANASGLMFDAVDRHNMPLVIHYDHRIVDPIFGAIETAVYARSDTSARQALHQADLLRDRTLSDRTAITVAFAAGLLLLAAFSMILLGLRRRVSTALRVEIERLASAALTDSLTGLRNHRAFQEDLVSTLQRQARARTPAALIMLDLNDLTTVNDTHGHQAGDDRLQLLAGALSETFRGGDCAYRVGGDEFAVILPGVSAWDALEATQRLQTALAPHAIDVTAGVADASGPRESDGLIREADLALIAGKRRHQVVTLYSPELQPAIGAVDLGRDAEHISSLSTALALAVDAKDSYTRSHCQTVSQLCVLIATELGLSPALIGQMRLAGLLHDVGKIGIPDAILTKPAALTDAEYEQMKRHSTLGAEIVAAAGLSTEARWIRHHHERYDGSGYPDRLAGKTIPLQSRIILTADAFEAMTSDRPYRDAPGREFAIAELKRHAGTQFDPTIVHAFCRALESLPDTDTDRHDDSGSDRVPAAQAEVIPV
jgi:diguanylate cyclase (GGDEF)-like protein/putative nucleotidyltransferase with HDIG domain